MIVYLRTIRIYSVFTQILGDVRSNNYAVSERLNCIVNFLAHLPDIQTGLRTSVSVQRDFIMCRR